jgi:hypothetical protein
MEQQRRVSLPFTMDFLQHVRAAMFLYKLQYSEHALKRYVERVRPGLTLGLAERELKALLPIYGVWIACPTWVESSPSRQGHDKYLSVGDDVLFVIREYHVVTCLTVDLRFHEYSKKRQLHKDNAREHHLGKLKQNNYRRYCRRDRFDDDDY